MVRESAQKYKQPMQRGVNLFFQLESTNAVGRNSINPAVFLSPQETGARSSATQKDIAAWAEQEVDVQERERQRIAMDLHDGLGQALTLINLELANATTMLAHISVSAEAQASLQRVKSKLQDAFGELRRTVMDLRPSMIDDLGILATLSWLFRELEISATHLTLEKYIGVRETDIPPLLRITIFRIVQESINNIVKHANADRVQVGFFRTEKILHLLIEDNGHGFDLLATGIPHRVGGGLAGIIRRARGSGGECTIESTVGRGTRVFVSWMCCGSDGATAHEEGVRKNTQAG